MGDIDIAGRAASGEPRPARVLAIIQLCLAILALSSTPILYRLSELGPTATSFYRTFFAVPVFVAWIIVERRHGAGPGSPLAALWRADGLVLGLGAAVFAANIVNYAWAIHFTSVANASLLSNLSPVFVSLGGFLLFGERVSRGFAGAMVMAIGGVALLTSDRLAIGRDQILGDGLALLSAVLFAAYLIIVGRLRQRLTSATIMLWTSAMAAISLLCASVATGESLIPPTLLGWSTLLGLAVISYALGQGLLVVAVSELGTAFSSVSLLSLPVTAALLGWILLAEPLTLQQMIGGAIILASIAGAKLASAKR